MNLLLVYEEEHKIRRLNKYLGALHSHIQRQVMYSKPKTIGEACNQAQYIKGDKKRMQSGALKREEQQRDSKKGWLKMQKNKGRNGSCYPTKLGT